MKGRQGLEIGRENFFVFTYITQTMKNKIVLVSLTVVSLSSFATESYQMGGFPSRPQAPNVEITNECDAQLGSVQRRRREFRNMQETDFSNTPDMQPLANPDNYQTHNLTPRSEIGTHQMGDNHPSEYYRPQSGRRHFDVTSEEPESDGQFR